MAATRLSRPELTWLFAHELGLQVTDLKRFDGRKRFQKLIYLLQHPPFSRDFGYRYNLYIHGPYSPDLAADGYEVAGAPDRFERVTHTYRLKPQAKQAVDDLKKRFQKNAAWNSAFLEFCATVHFLYHHTYVYVPARERLELVRRAATGMKPHLSQRLDECIAVLRDAEMLH
jgi:hypothetical protein